MNYLQQSLKRTFSGLRQHKFLFMITIISQMVFITALVYIGLTYQLKIVENSQYILQAMDSAQYNAESLQQGQPFVADYLQLYQHYQTLITVVIQAAIWLSGLFLTGMGVLWLFSHQIISPAISSWKRKLTLAGKEIIKIISAIIIFLAPIVLIGYWWLRSMVEPDPELILSRLKIMGYLLLVTYYLLLVALAFVSSGWKIWIKQFVKAVIKNIHKTLLVLLINATLMMGSLFLVYYSLEIIESFPLLVVASILSLILMVLTRVWWIACLQEITNEKSAP